MSLQTLLQLDDYSCSLPSGTVINKRWRRLVPWNENDPDAKWWMGEYAESNEPDYVDIVWREIFIKPYKNGEPFEGTIENINAYRVELALREKEPPT